MPKDIPPKYKKALAEISMKSALEADQINYAPHFLSSFGLPAKYMEGNEFMRTNGKYELQIVSPSSIGLPFGPYPRLILVYLATQALIYRDRRIYMGTSRAHFIRRLGRYSTGGTGPLRSFNQQFQRLFASSIKIIESTEKHWEVESVNFSVKARCLWERPVDGEFLTLILTQEFYRDICSRAFPVDGRVVSVLAKNILALDIYFWLTARLFKLKRRTQIRWIDLSEQFGNHYSTTSNFKTKFSDALALVGLFYPEANVIIIDDGVILLPSKPHIPPMSEG